jgi:biopolymer transport protein ExbD
MDFERHKMPIRQISMVPLINVVFLLLIFFLVAGTVEKIDVIDVELPEAQSGEVIEEGPIEILLGRYDEVIANDQPMDMYGIEAWLAPKLEDDPERVITIKADARMHAARMIDLLDHLKRAGATHISLTTQEQ